MASFRIQQDKKPSNKLKMRGASRSHALNNWLEFWKMIQDTFKDKKGNWKNPLDTVKDLGTAYAGADRLKKYNDVLGK